VPTRWKKSSSSFSVTRERIEMEGKALRKLKHQPRSKKLRSFLDN